MEEEGDNTQLSGKNMDYRDVSNEELERLVNNKDGEAICELGERCLYGRNNHPVNLTRAYQLFHKGEKMGLSRAYIGLGEMYRNGIRFAQNESLAREYYRKAGVPYPDMNSSANEKRTDTGHGGIGKSHEPKRNSQQFDGYNSTKNPAGITEREIREKLDRADKNRENENYEEAKILCGEIIQNVNSVLSGIVVYSGRTDINDLLIEAYWILTYVAFNEQKYQEMEGYFSQEGVQGLHPWGVYLMAIAHRITQAPEIILQQDLQALIMVCRNQNMSQQQRGDVNTMIGDLLMEGYGNQSGASPQMAKPYYEEAMRCGNQYAREQYQRLN